MLLVSDDEWLFRSLETVLGDRAIVVRRAATIATAVDALRATAVDVVVVEHHPPRLDAVAACATIASATQERAPLALVVIAHVADRAFRTRAFSSGAWQVLAWPAEGEIFVTQVETFCRAARAAERARADHALEVANPQAMQVDPG